MPGKPSRPPKNNMLEVIKLLEREVERCRSTAISHQGLVDNLPRPGVDAAYWQRSATAQFRKAQRIGVVLEWLERSYDER